MENKKIRKKLTYIEKPVSGCACYIRSPQTNGHTLGVFQGYLDSEKLEMVLTHEWVKKEEDFNFTYACRCGLKMMFTQKKLIVESGNTKIECCEFSNSKYAYDIIL